MTRWAIGIGVQRAGTSWLHRALEEHPAVSGALLANNKELDFFTAGWDRGEGAYRDLFPQEAEVALEFSVSYFPSLDATARIRASFPDARLLVCLRDPVDRALSQHRFFLARGAAPLPFHQALERNRSMEEQSRYGTHLARWITAFGRDALHVVLQDDIVHRPTEVVSDVCAHLGLAAHVPSVLGSRINAPDHASRVRVRRAMAATSEVLRRAGGARLLAAVERTGVPDRLRDWVRDDTEHPLGERDRQAMEDMRRRLAPEVRRVEELVGRDLSAWLPEGGT